MDLEFFINKTDCAPTISKNSEICSSQEMLKNLKDWLQIQSQNPKEIIQVAKTKLSCPDETCVLETAQEKGALSEDDVSKVLKVKGPWDSTKWLDNENIDCTLEQYAEKFSGFHPIKFQMRDFAKYPTQLSTFNWQKPGIKYVACALNTDLTGNPGEHWTALFVDYPSKTVEYFDSAGNTPHQEFLELIVGIASKLDFRDISVTTVKHQVENTECGVYTLYYILSRLHGIPYKKFMTKRVPDDMMVAFRKYLFRHN
jgi:hypothetical protein